MFFPPDTNRNTAVNCLVSDTFTLYKYEYFEARSICFVRIMYEVVFVRDALLAAGSCDTCISEHCAVLYQVYSTKYHQLWANMYVISLKFDTPKSAHTGMNFAWAAVMKCVTALTSPLAPLWNPWRKRPYEMR